ncbi:MAG: LLM class flavin-dependent oxidoreductase [Steroidobacteraceae bacterium]|jgi:alkanesulfonate monooxygenase SsuD/methylene tetrahydromethanopterin reductase-like flavin-dependent oxidoreductase (luciferase family)|nr:LLM class flavin-dependent oxidoreductase [Steroidobacteraceae bacterium]
MTTEAGAATHPLRTSRNRLKLGVFGLNVSHGCSMTDRPEVLKVTWPESVRLAQLADRAGFEALIPVARWKGMGGRTNFNHRNFETFTWAAGLSAVTQRISVFATFHVPTVHPVRAAKEVATIDHISGGRFGLNIVAGWNEREIGMFGLPQKEHDARYDVADDWLELCRQLWTREGEFDYAGPYFTSPGAYSEPKPIQRPHPVIMSAGNSARGQQFAAQNADLNFVIAKDVAGCAQIAARGKALAREKYGREMQVFGQAYVVCAETEKEAKELERRYVHETGDWTGVRNLLDVLIPNSQSALGAGWEAFAANLIAGYGAIPLVGTAEQIVDGMKAFADAGLDGITLSWVDYGAGLEHFETVLLPMLRQAGLRE